MTHTNHTYNHYYLYKIQKTLPPLIVQFEFCRNNNDYMTSYCAKSAVHIICTDNRNKKAAAVQQASIFSNGIQVRKMKKHTQKTKTQ